MSKAQTTTQTKTAKIQNSYLFTFVATLSGVMVGVFASLAMMGPMIHSEVASATNGLTRSISALPADSITSCTGTATPAASGAASVKTAVATMPGGGGQGGQGGSGNTFVTKLIGGAMNNTTASISDTGKDSHNSITTNNTTTTTVENHNDVNVVNANAQWSSTGNASANANTNGGNATTGNSANSYDSSTSINISN